MTCPLDRRDEVRRLLAMSPAAVRRRAGDRLVVLPDVDALHEHFAEELAGEIEANERRGRWTNLILPVGPTGQYPLLAERINRRGISLKRCRFFMMDELCDENGVELPASHPLSFRRALHELLLERIRRPLRPAGKNVVFPTRDNVHRLAERIERSGGIQTAYGGIGIHGHVAFNEPEPHVRDSEPRLVYLNEFTRTINAIRARIGGNLEGYPRKALTLGMRQILEARRVRLYCRNGIALDWANTVLRLALLGTPGDDYPVTYLREHPDCVIVTDEQTLASPENVV
ncbi:MAG: hypothetical protein D6725_13300 [Planctomycetota bacterium]|nr:MAG: hypothetical protein D6725_13300 [Planctomycetota bacterium]